jgi:hypothetical protein
VKIAAPSGVASADYARWLSKTDRMAATAGKSYSASVNFKTSAASAGAKLVLNFWDANQAYLGGVVSSAVGKGTADWTLVAVAAFAPPNTRTMRVEFRLYGSGTLWIDDIVVR